MKQSNSNTTALCNSLTAKWISYISWFVWWYFTAHPH